MCERCEGKGWYFRTPDGFNPFLAGGWGTIRAMYKVICGCPLGKSLGVRNSEPK